MEAELNIATLFNVHIIHHLTGTLETSTFGSPYGNLQESIKTIQERFMEYKAENTVI